MNPDLSRPRPARGEEHPLLLPLAERELPAGRHQFHKERLMAQIHEDLRAADIATAAAPAAPARATGPRNPFLRRAVFVPAAAFALAGALAMRLPLLRGPGRRGRTRLHRRHGPGADHPDRHRRPQGGAAAPGPDLAGLRFRHAARPCARTSSSTSAARRPTPT